MQWAKNISLEDEIDESRRKGTETHIPSSEVGIAASSTEQGHSLCGRCPESIWDLGRLGEAPAEEGHHSRQILSFPALKTMQT